MTDTFKNLLIGIFVLAACGLIVFILLFIHPSLGDEGQKVRVRFADIDKVNPGTRVTYAGKPIGEVISIHEIDQTKTPRQAVDGYVYVYELVLGIDSRTKIYNTDKILLRTSGLLGERSVEISPEPAAPDEKIYVVNDKILYAVESGSVEETLKQFKNVAGKIQVTLDKLNSNLDEIGHQKIWERLGTTAKNVSDITTALNKPKQWTELLANIHDLSKNALTTWAKIDTAVDHVAKATSNFSDISVTVKEGKSTIGKLLVKDDFYLRMSALFSKAETLFDDINQYGLLFNLDKGWQRLRARRANLITRLCSPMQFYNFFNDEINQITSSLARVSMVLEETECMQPDYLMSNAEFRKVFGDLLRRITDLEHSVQLYNQQLDDVETKATQINPCCFPCVN